MPGSALVPSAPCPTAVSLRVQHGLAFIPLYFRNVMGIAIQFASNGTVNPGEAEPLFMTRVGGVVQSAHMQQYVVSDNSQKFLMSIVVEEALSPITLILHWKPPAK